MLEKRGGVKRRGGTIARAQGTMTITLANIGHHNTSIENHSTRTSYDQHRAP